MFKPIFTINPDMLTAISEIAEIKQIVERSRVLPLNEAQLKRQAIIRMVHTSTSIEGNPLAEFQVDKALSGGNINADDKSIKEIRNYQNALKEVDRLSELHQPISIESILGLHSILMQGLLEESRIGHFRPGPIYLVDDLGDGREVLRYVGPEASKVAFYVNELLLWLYAEENSKLHPILKAAIFHVQFLTIHPFADGNGRITRLLTTLILYNLRWDFRKILVLEDFYNKDREAYYNALNTVQGDKYHSGEDLGSWIEYFLIGFLVESRKVRDLIAQTGLAPTTSIDRQVFLDKDEIKIMDFLSSTGNIVSNDVMEILGIAKRTAQLKLKTLQDKGLIKLEGKGPASFYSLVD